MNNVLSKETLIPLGLVVTIGTMLVAAGMFISDARTIQAKLAIVESKFEDQNRRLAIIENRQGVTEAQYSEIKSSTQEIKEDIKSIQQALRIKP
jgi:chromosome segregation ATPase